MPAPPPRELKVASAYFALLGYSQATIAKKIRRTPRTQQMWRKEDDWPEIEQEARTRYLRQIAGYGRRAIKRGMTKQDGHWFALNILERIDKDLVPAKQRHALFLGEAEAEAVDDTLDHVMEEMEQRYSDDPVVRASRNGTQ